MTQLQIDMNHLIAKVRPYLGNSTLNRGWDYFMDSEVSHLVIRGEEDIQARVQGTSTYKVKLDLLSFTFSSCTCPYNGYCKHMAAVVFEVCHKSDLDPYTFLYPNSKQGKKTLQPAILQLVNGSSATHKKNPQQPSFIKPNELSTAAEWHDYYEQKFKNVRMKDMSDLDSFYAAVKRELEPLADTWQPTLRALYLIHVQLFAMKLAGVMYQNFSSSYYYFDVRRYFEKINGQCIVQLIKWVDQLNKNEAKQQYDSHLTDMIRFLAELAFPQRETVIDWPFVYRLLWQHALTEKSWREAERARLEALFKHKELQPKQRDMFVLARSYFDVMDDKDERAIELLRKELIHKDTEYFLGFLQTFLQNQQWEKLILWLRLLLPQMELSGHYELDAYMQYWKAAGNHLPVHKEWERAMRSLLPGSYQYYGKYLLDAKQYQEWVDLCLFMDITPLEVPSATLKLVESSNVEYILPFYHYAAEQYILQKNRGSYKLAVKMLKKLHTHYKKLKELDRWEQYIGYIAKQFSRYRAFQEELRKGKLIG